MSEQSQRPTIDDREGWKAYWAAQGMPWRTEPEIATAGQRLLVKRESHERIEGFQGTRPMLSRTSPAQRAGETDKPFPFRERLTRRR